MNNHQIAGAIFLIYFLVCNFVQAVSMLRQLTYAFPMARALVIKVKSEGESKIYIYIYIYIYIHIHIYVHIESAHA